MFILQAPASPAHTLDKFLPQRLQDEAAAATALRQATAKTSERRDDVSRVSSPSVPVSTTASASSDAATSLSEAPAPSVPPAVERAVSNSSSQPYITPMPTPANLTNGAANQRAQDKINGHGNNGQIADAGGKKALVGQIAQKSNGMGMSSTDEDDVDDLEAPSSFCCPITTVTPDALCLLCLFNFGNCI